MWKAKMCGATKGNSKKSNSKSQRKLQRKNSNLRVYDFFIVDVLLMNLFGIWDLIFVILIKKLQRNEDAFTYSSCQEQLG
jgi:hypothetical protein